MRLLIPVSVLITAVAIILSCSPLDSFQVDSEKSDTFNYEESRAMVFLSSLNTEQRKKAQMPLEDSSRERWHYLPSTFWTRAGIQLKDLSPDQKELAFELLKSHLSKSGYDKARQVIELEKILAVVENNPRSRDPEKYHVAIYGNPAKDKVWAWSFEGHHLSLNFTIVDKEVAIAPRFFGANPATIDSGERKGERTLAEEADLGLKLVNSLTDDQKQKALLQEETFRDIVTGNKAKVEPLSPEGIKASEFEKPQKDVLLKLINVYLSSMPEKLARVRAENLRNEELEEIRFSWAGATVPRKPHYYRIQGKTFLIEFDNTQNSGNHIHSVWRDFDGDFGRDLIREHYEVSDH